jgi:hypothetical protein
MVADKDPEDTRKMEKKYIKKIIFSRRKSAQNTNLSEAIFFQR